MKTCTIHCGSFGNQFDFSQKSLDCALNRLPGTRFQKSVLRYRRSSHQWMSLLSRKLLIKGLIKLNQPLDKKAIWSESTNGRPYITGFPDFNLSHSGKIAVCAIGTDNARVGIDVQIEKPIRNQLLKQVFTQRELDWVSEEENKIARLWSRKEAVAKLLGHGMRINFQSLETLSDQVPFEGKVYYLNSIPVARGYQCTLAGETPLAISLNKYRWSSLNQLEEKFSSSVIQPV